MWWCTVKNHLVGMMTYSEPWDRAGGATARDDRPQRKRCVLSFIRHFKATETVERSSWSERHWH